MRIGLLSDIHANAHALRAVLKSAKGKNVEKLLCCGDYVGYYYEPDRVIALLDEWDWDGISGNHETMLLDWLNEELTRIELQISRIQNLITLLTEYRTALISEVVTGKIKVTD